MGLVRDCALHQSEWSDDASGYPPKLPLSAFRRHQSKIDSRAFIWREHEVCRRPLSAELPWSCIVHCSNDAVSPARLEHIASANRVAETRGGRQIARDDERARRHESYDVRYD